MPDEEIDAARAADRITTAHFRAGGRVIATMCTGMAQWFHERDDPPEGIAAQYGEFALGLLGANRVGSDVRS